MLSSATFFRIHESCKLKIQHTESAFVMLCWWVDCSVLCYCGRSQEGILEKIQNWVSDGEMRDNLGEKNSAVAPEAPPDSDYLSLLRYLSFLVFMVDLLHTSESFAKSFYLE